MKKHKHSETIHAWADGAVIEFKEGGCGWEKIDYPSWKQNTEYRVKPDADYKGIAKNLIRRLSDGEVISRQRGINLDFAEIAKESSESLQTLLDAIQSLESERELNLTSIVEGNNIISRLKSELKEAKSMIVPLELAAAWVAFFSNGDVSKHVFQTKNEALEWMESNDCQFDGYLVPVFEALGARHPLNE